MYPHERSLVEEMKDQPFALIGVNSDDLPRAKKAVAENGLSWRSFQNKPAGSQQAIADVWAVRGWPTIVILDGERRIHYRGHDGEEATKVARELLAARKQKGGG
jgi:hypothetical protein